MSARQSVRKSKLESRKTDKFKSHKGPSKASRRTSRNARKTDSDKQMTKVSVITTTTTTTRKRVTIHRASVSRGEETAKKDSVKLRVKVHRQQSRSKKVVTKVATNKKTTGRKVTLKSITQVTGPANNLSTEAKTRSKSK